jgi:hypothetical protein
MALARHPSAVGFSDHQPDQLVCWQRPPHVRPQWYSATQPTQHGSAKAAALLFSICQNHTLLDGNKRLAWAAAVTFLALNGFPIPEIDVDAAEAFMLSSGWEAHGGGSDRGGAPRPLRPIVGDHVRGNARVEVSPDGPGVIQSR